jgi:hypothetical protein
MHLLSVLLLALANIGIAISQESSDFLIPVNHYARILNSGEERNLMDVGAVYNIPQPIVHYCNSSASFVLLFNVNVSPSLLSLSLSMNYLSTTYSIRQLTYYTLHLLFASLLYHRITF